MYIDKNKGYIYIKRENNSHSENQDYFLITDCLCHHASD